MKILDDHPATVNIIILLIGFIEIYFGYKTQHIVFYLAAAFSFYIIIFKRGG